MDTHNLQKMPGLNLSKWRCQIPRWMDQPDSTCIQSWWLFVTPFMQGVSELMVQSNCNDNKGILTTY